MAAETQSVQEATGINAAHHGALVLAAWRGQSREARKLIELTIREAGLRGEGSGLTISEYAHAVLCNGAGQYEEGFAAARSASEHQEIVRENWGLPELIESAVRTGRTDLAADALERLAAKAEASGTDWALGVEARSRALLSEGDQADAGFREAIDRLSRTRVRAELARTHLLYGEWLRREQRGRGARAELRMAHDMLDAMGMEAFAERARRELLAAGETVRNRSVETISVLTAQEAYIARLAREGRTNPEIGAQLFLSARTVEWHLRKVFTKLGITSRRELSAALTEAGPLA
jgi:DNA-binding CsgD family transcriptional regulator